MKKFILLLFIIIIAALIGVTFSLGYIVKRGVETAAPRILGVPVNVNNIDISLINGTIGINKLTIHNPEGYSKGAAFSLRDIKVKLDIPSIFSDTVIINDISVIDPEINYEIGLGNTNINTLMNNVNKNSASSETTPSGKPAKKVIIKNLDIQQTKVEAKINSTGTHVNLPEIHMKDIGKDGHGVTFAEAGKKVLGALTDELEKVNTAALTQGTVKKFMDNVGDKVKGWFGN
jgi:hypothetical protein